MCWFLTATRCHHLSSLFGWEKLRQTSSADVLLLRPTVSPDNQFRMSILERLEQMERRMAEMASHQRPSSVGGGGTGGGAGGAGGGGGSSSQSQVDSLMVLTHSSNQAHREPLMIHFLCVSCRLAVPLRAVWWWSVRR